MVETNITQSQFIRLAKKYNVIPLCSDVLISDFTSPTEVFHTVFSGKEDAFLLESVEGEEKVARYSFIGFTPLFIFISENNGVTLKDVLRKEARSFLFKDSPLTEMKKLLKAYRVYPAPYLPRFKGGFVGFTSYALARFFEPTAFKKPAVSRTSDAYFMFPKYLISFDHRAQTVRLFNFVVLPKKMPGRALIRLFNREHNALRSIASGIGRTKLKPLPLPETGCSLNKHRTSNFSKQTFMRAVRKAKQYIREGDIIQVVLSQKFSVGFNGDPFTVYRYLKYLNPSPYLYFLKCGSKTIIGSSPEMLVRVDGKKVTTCPIAGTRRRGTTDEEDAALHHELLNDEKEKAEHIMLVDLARNDIGRIARPRSVKATRLMAVEKFSHVMHMVSEVEGTLLQQHDMFSAFASCFPAGTVSGAPKIRAMQIIEELEPEQRGIYAGSIGYFSFFEELDSCITIRTIVIDGKKAFIQAGAGIVADSVPEKEYEETLNKAKAQLYALQMAQYAHTRR